MSYILEALKKAQSERQLGSAPTIHAVPIQAAHAEPVSAGRLPLWIALAAVTLLALGAVALWWRQAPAAPAPVPVVVQQAAVVPTPAPVPAPPPVAIVMQAPPIIPPVVVAKPLPRPAPAPVVAPPPPVAKPAPVAEAVTPSVEDALPFARDLPEPARGSLPQVVFGGYMYSKNPADRLLLIDKVLRHEGEEVAPGLVLEKLLPRAAVMNYRGTRYRVAY